MDWLKSSLQAAQKQAQETAEKAKALAQQASQQARVLAEQASEQAKVLAEQASEQAKVFAGQASERAKVLASAAAEEAQAKFQQLASASAQVGRGASGQGDAELAKYGITPGLLETISGMTYSTFSDYPMEQLATDNPLGLKPPIPSPGFKLNPWQERHALLVLTRGDQLQGLRFALCPKRMDEELFWIIYFTLVKTLLPPEAFRPASAEDEAGSPGPASFGAGVAGRGAESRSASVGSSSGAALEHTSAASSSKRLSVTTAAGGTAPGPGSVPSPTTSRTTAGSSTAPGTAASGAAAASAAAAGGQPALVGGEGVLVDMGNSSTAGDDPEGDDDEDEEGDGGDVDLDALEDDPELAAYLEEALDVQDGDEGGGEGLSDLGTATDDLDDYINQLDAELGAGGEGPGSGDGEYESPAKSPAGKEA